MALVMINIVLSLTRDCFHNPSGKGRIPPRIGYTALVMTRPKRIHSSSPPINSMAKRGGGDVLMAGSKKTSSLKTLQAKWTGLGIPK